MSLITKPKVAPSADQDHPMPCQDPVVHSIHFCEEAANELARDEAFQRTLRAAVDDGGEQERLAKQREAKATFWLQKMVSGEPIDWDGLVERLRKRDRRSAEFLQKLVARARENGLLEE